MKTCSSLLLVCATLALPSTVTGQVCQGAPPLHDRAARLNGEVALGIDARRFEIGAGTSRGSLFASAAGGSYQSNNIDLFVVAGIGRLGLERALTPRIAVCPAVELSLGRYGGRHFEGTTLTQWTVAPGVALGLVAVDRPSIRVVPAVNVKVVTAYYTGSAVGTHADARITFGLAQIGVGIVRGRFGVLPAVSIPIGLSLRDTAMIVAVTTPLP